MARVQSDPSTFYPGTTPLEGVGAGGDSGGPAFIQTASGLAIAGLNAWGDATPQSHLGRYDAQDYSTRVSSYLDWIDDTVAAFQNASPELTIQGTCPGPITVEMRGMQPGGRSVLLLSSDTAQEVVPGGRCAGASIGVELPLILHRRVRPDASGDFTIQATPSAGMCDAKIQLLDLETCQVSPVRSL